MEDMRKIPVVALRGMTVLPNMVIHFDISRTASVHAVQEAMLRDQKVFLLTQRDMNTLEPKEKDLYRVGTIASVKQVMKLPKNVLRVLVEGETRAELDSILHEKPYLFAEVITTEDTSPETLEEEKQTAMLRTLKEVIMEYAVTNPKMNKDSVTTLLDIHELGNLVDMTCNSIPIYYEEQQKLLDALTLTERYDVLFEMLTKEMRIAQYTQEIQEKVKERLDKNQKDYYMREQIKILQEELGEDDNMSDADRFEEEVDALDADEEIKAKLRKEIRYFRNAGQSSAEAGVHRTYIETMLEMPWNKTTDDDMDLIRAKEILDADHYGLEEVKERVLEYLAVRTLADKGISPILCLVGPPGTGKTSIAKSIAESLGKKYARISLGGIRDEAEIRGHRKTYIGAMPGRIANAIRMAGTKNPLILLDEIDKVSSDYKGDTFSALLEVLDSEQNVRFRDHYLEVPLDLSEVLFVTTANTTETIPRPLLDRMELIEVNSYTENEKMHIAQEHLIPKQLKKHGLTKSRFVITPLALEKVIRFYTREAGVRQLERKISELCRKGARQILEQDKKRVSVNVKNLEAFLGKERYSFMKANTENEVGIVRGLAWTSVGGDTLQIEVNVMEGKGEIMLTGQMGDVMKESARTGISYIRSIAPEYRVDAEFFAKHDIHVHIPEGAVPKDGPSAGITMATAMLSAITGRAVRADVAMTGEITLRGRVLPIGGLKEKLLAAKNAGIQTVIVPKKNARDVQDISEEITGGLEIRYVESMKEVLPIAWA